jgi:hypothetical protein
VDGGGWMNQDFNQKNSNFKRNIFGWKVSFRMFSYYPDRDFYNLKIRISNGIFSAEKCLFIWNPMVPTGTFTKKKHKPNQWMFHIPVRLFRSNIKYNIARYYIKHYSTIEWPSWVFWP